MDNKPQPEPKSSKDTYGKVVDLIDLQFGFVYDNYTAAPFWKEILESGDIDKVAEALALGISHFAP